MENNFSANARIILEIGRESIENKIIALSEIVKNSYDAGADNCQINLIEGDVFVSLLDKEINEITIIDDGSGMDYNDLVNNWLIIGTNDKLNKKLTIKNENLKTRVPIGEKGIGRFAVNKLGNEIELITKRLNDKCYRLFINFNDFENDRKLDEIKVKITEISDIKFLGRNHGTKIVIKNLREKWDEVSIKNAYDELLKLQSPFNNKTDYFKIIFQIPNKDLLKGRLSPKEILRYSIWESEVQINDNNENPIMKFKFKPYKQMKELSKISIDIPIKLFLNSNKSIQKLDLSKYNIGPIKIKLYAFHRSSAVLRMIQKNRDNVKNYLDEHGGVRVYRDKQRIYNYGSQNEDWLGLNLKRLNNPGSKLSKNILIGIVEINGLESRDLTEKTNREGFIDNAAFYCFKEIVSLVVDEFAFNLINTKDKIKLLYDKNLKQDKLNDTFSELIYEVNNLNYASSEDKQKVLVLIQNLSTQYIQSKQLLLSIANTSVDFHMVFHDIEKQVKLLIKMLNNGSDINEVKNIANSIKDVLNLQHDLITNRDFKQIKSNDIVSTFKQYAKYRLIDHRIDLILEIEDITVMCVGSQILRVLINLFDNSVYWLGTKESNRKVFLKIYKEAGNNCFIFADNGPGILKIYEDDIFKPFVTKKKDGIGLGLYIVNEIVELHNGSIQLVDGFNNKIPQEFNDGARFLIELKGNNDVK